MLRVLLASLFSVLLQPSPDADSEQNNPEDFSYQAIEELIARSQYPWHRLNYWERAKEICRPDYGSWLNLDAKTPEYSLPPESLKIWIISNDNSTDFLTSLPGAGDINYALTIMGLEASRALSESEADLVISYTENGSELDPIRTGAEITSSIVDQVHCQIWVYGSGEAARIITRISPHASASESENQERSACYASAIMTASGFPGFFRSEFPRSNHYSVLDTATIGADPIESAILFDQNHVGILNTQNLMCLGSLRAVYPFENNSQHLFSQRLLRILQDIEQEQ